MLVCYFWWFWWFLVIEIGVYVRWWLWFVGFFGYGGYRVHGGEVFWGGYLWELVLFDFIVYSLNYDNYS